jgi:hypothetical protein
VKVHKETRGTDFHTRVPTGLISTTCDIRMWLDEKEFLVTSRHSVADVSYWKLDSSSRRPEQLHRFVYPRLLTHVCRGVRVVSILQRTRDRSNYTIRKLCDEP